ncbi:MAG: hopanoid biosynthesis-associated protein HpnK [Firmicutes bacterium]|nr:hopanoid biosynthesis-associated protein HpnK [Bacillota bacterium]
MPGERPVQRRVPEPAVGPSPGATGGGYVILNADDFGRWPSINQAVLRAHREGILTSASLVVTGDAFEEAVALARATPTLAVGLHLVLVQGRPALPPDQVPDLVGSDGRFGRDPARLWLHYWADRRAAAELEREVRAQFERFAATGLPLSHVDGHLHFHLHPAVADLVVELAREYGAGGVRVPRDDVALALRHDRSSAAMKVLWAWGLGVFARRVETAARRAPGGGRPRTLVVADRVYGLLQSGRMEEAYVLRVIDSLAGSLREGRGRPVFELFFHPDTADPVELFGPNPGDLECLLSPAVRRALERGGLEPTSYRALSGVSAREVVPGTCAAEPRRG